MAKDTLLLQAALNGNRDHPALPRTPQELAREALAAVKAGARALHLHPYDDDGHETLEPKPYAAALRAVRAVCPGLESSARLAIHLLFNRRITHSVLGHKTITLPGMLW